MIEFCLCLLSFEALLLENLFGMVAVLVFMMPWAWIVVTRWQKAQQRIISNWGLLSMPALAVLSAAWSIEHIWTLKAGLELTATFVCGILAAELIKPRALICALLTAFMIVATLSVLNGNITAVGNNGEEALTGIFASKNAFSAMMSVLLLLSLSVYLDKTYPLLFRIEAVLGILLTPLLLYHGRSVGTIVALLLTLLIFFFFRMLRRAPPLIRVLTVLVTAMVALICLFAVMIYDINPMSILGLVGKDATLTGRTHLWSRALDFISDRPLGGVGYRTFWRVGYPPAEELWYFAGVPSGAGFNFHNEYLEMLVENGVIGLMLLLTYLWVMSRRVLVRVFKPLRAHEIFTIMMFITLITRTPLEVSLFNQFNVVVILVCMVWVYLRPKSPVTNSLSAS